MGKEELIGLLNRASDIEGKFKTVGGGSTPEIRTIYRNQDFQNWKAELKYKLQKMDQDPLIEEILHLLDSGFKNGYRDEKDFIALKAKLNVLSSHIDDYFKGEIEPSEMKMKKGTIVKTAFDDYTLIQQVGEGGNGQVFSATSKDGNHVAIKYVKRDIGSEKYRRFKNELHFCENHNHKNIVEIIDRGFVIFSDIEYAFYVMPLYSESLREKIKRKIDPEDAVSVFVGIIEGLKFAHGLKTIHRDIKPENILFSQDSLEPVICDFGIAHFAEEELLTIVETKKSDRLANFQYSAPEQRAKGGEATPQTDLYATALILNEMFTGQVPQARDHKTIASVAPKYGYLDEIFNDLYKQNADDRLYPEDKILEKMKTLPQKYQHDQDVKQVGNALDFDFGYEG